MVRSNLKVTYEMEPLRSNHHHHHHHSVHSRAQTALSTSHHTTRRKAYLVQVHSRICVMRHIFLIRKRETRNRTNKNGSKRACTRTLEKHLVETECPKDIAMTLDTQFNIWALDMHTIWYLKDTINTNIERNDTNYNTIQSEWRPDPSFVR